MRILHVVPYFMPDGHGGVQSHVSSLAHEMGKRHDVVVLAFTHRRLSGEMQVEQGDKFTIHRISRPGYESNRLDERWPELERNYGSAIRKIQPDVIHLHQLAGLSTELVNISKQVARSVVFTLHDYLSICPVDTIDTSGRICFSPGNRCYSCVYPDVFSRKRELGLWRITNPLLMLIGAMIPNLTQVGKRLQNLSKRKQIYFEALEASDRIIAPSRAIAKVFADSGLTSEITVISHGVDPPQASSRRTQITKPLRFGFIGSNRVKGLELLLKAFRDIDNNEAELYVYSNIGSHTRPLRRRIRKLAHRSNVHIIVGGFDPYTKEQVFNQFDVLVAPSIWIEPFGLVAAEAEIRGVPVIASDNCGLEETVIHGVNGLLFERGNVKALVSAMKRLILEPNLLSRLRKGCGRAKLISDQAAEIEQVYVECLR